MTDFVQISHRFLLFKLLTWIFTLAKRKLPSLKVASVWAVLHTLLLYWQWIFFLQKTWLKSHYCDCTHSSHCFEHEQKLIARFRNSPSWSLVTNLLFRITGWRNHTWIKLTKSRDFIKRGFMSNCFKPWFQNVKIQMLSISWICKWFLTDLRLGL